MAAGEQHFSGLDPHAGPIDYENDTMGIFDASVVDSGYLPMKRVLRDVVDARQRCLGTGSEGALWQLLIDDGEGKVIYHPPNFSVTIDQTEYLGNFKYVAASNETSIIDVLQDANYTRISAPGSGSSGIGALLCKSEFEAGDPGNFDVGEKVGFSFENVRFNWTRSHANSTSNMLLLHNFKGGYVKNCQLITTENDTYYYTPIDVSRAVSDFEFSHSYVEINCENLQGGLWIRSLRWTRPTENIHYHHLHIKSNSNDEPVSVFADDGTNSGPLRNIRVDHVLCEMVGPSCNGPSLTNVGSSPGGIETPERDFDAHMSHMTVILWNMNNFGFQLKNAHGCSLTHSRLIVYNTVGTQAKCISAQSTDAATDERDFQEQPVLVQNVAVHLSGEHDVLPGEEPFLFHGRMVNRDCSVLTTTRQQMVLTTASGDFTRGGEIRNNASRSAATKFGTVLSVSGTAPNLTITYVMASQNADFVASETLYDVESTETATAVTPTTTGTQELRSFHEANYGGGIIRDGNYRAAAVSCIKTCTDVRGGHYFWDTSQTDVARKVVTILSGSTELPDRAMKFHDFDVILTDDPQSSTGRVSGIENIAATLADPYTVSIKNITLVGSTNAITSTFSSTTGGNSVVVDYSNIIRVRGGVTTSWGAPKVVLTASLTVPPLVPMVEIDHATLTRACTMDASRHVGLFTVKNTSASGTQPHTLTLTTGTFDGTNTIATLDAPGEALVVSFDSDGNGVVVANVGSVALS